MIRPIFLIAFTGHRPKETEGRTRNELHALRPQIKQAIEKYRQIADQANATLELTSSAADGADIFACEAAIDLGIPLHLIIPLPEEQFAEDFMDSSTSWKEAQAIIFHCSTGKNGSTFRVARGSSTRSDCYEETNIQMLDVADALIAVWDQVLINELGGTSRMIQQAKDRKLSIIEIHSKTAQLYFHE